MNRITFNLLQLHEHGPAFRDFLRLRKKFFVDELHWEIPHDRSVEMDQYDNPTAYYSLVYYHGQLVGGARAMSTGAEWGSHSYMLRDVWRGKLNSIPASVMRSEIATPSVWEVTRLVISDELTTQVERSECLRQILNGIVDMASAEGAAELMSLSPVIMARTLRQTGFKVRLDGEPYFNDEDGRRYAVLRMPTHRSTKESFLPPVPVPQHSDKELVLN